jgi:ribosome-associated translation inhibitor RaiA
MSETPKVLVHHRDVHIGAHLLESIERRCATLADEFSEASRFELSFENHGMSVRGQVHATGRRTDLATHAEASDPGIVVDRVLDKIEKQLRRIHDKRVYGRRRDAQRAALKKRQPED